ncbi:hypothetical protein D9758_002219 [Tetrapyrgos nigripes]|uniref:Uncharacterized protein n=1 Tax=Tetrapyrgos nigripes TaxID=182062 RepID=A0A8H5LT12_9AGAR|nr:hypothetical protein D9758_002219 [Tetrapyrgos nigripes]
MSPRSHTRLRVDNSDLRSRTRLFSSQYDSLYSSQSLPVKGIFRSPNTRHTKWILWLAILALGFMFFLILSLASEGLQGRRIKGVPEFIDIASRSNNFSQESTHSPFSYKIPVIDRSILAKLEALERHEPPLQNDISFGEPHNQSSAFRQVMELCQEGAKPCRFLVPFRIAEQESKARQHLINLFELAHRLDRILVLPNVGKSRLGLCSSWSFETYYDVQTLAESLKAQGTKVVDMKSFLTWIDDASPFSTVPSSPSAQSLFFRMGGNTDFLTTEPVAFRHEDFEVSLYPRHVLTYPGLPWCFETQLYHLDLSRFPPILVQFPKGRRLAGDSVVEALQGDELQKIVSGVPYEPTLSSVPDILLIDYSPKLIQLAKRLSPPHPYLTIHWRMESVAAEVLPDCAYSLVHMLSDILHNPALSEGIQTVWFASDFPFPLAHFTETPSSLVRGSMSAPTSKSSTFRDFGAKHSEAVQILLDAFRLGGELENWKITDQHEAQSNLDVGGPQDLRFFPDVRQDSGVLGILDKLVGMDATLFISGTKGCGRASSFTKQIIDVREQGQASVRRNVVDFFW